MLMYTDVALSESQMLPYPLLTPPRLSPLSPSPSSSLYHPPPLLPSISLPIQFPSMSLLHLYYRRCFNPALFTASSTWCSRIKRDSRTFSYVQLMTYRIVPCHTISHHTVLCYAISYYAMSYRVILYCIMSYHIVS